MALIKPADPTCNSPGLLVLMCMCVFNSLKFYHMFRLMYLPLVEKEMATLSSTLAWKIPWTEEPGRLQSLGLPRVGHD